MTTEPLRWFKSSYSNNGGQCVEVAANLAATSWFKSTYSEHGGQCVEVAANVGAADGVVAVRDSKDPAGPALTFPASAFAAFVEGIREGEFGTV